MRISAESPPINLWNATINSHQSNTDEGRGVAVDSSGNIYVTGWTYWSSNESYDIYLGKFDSSGQNLWNRTINGPKGYNDFGYGVAVDSSGNIYVTGYSYWSYNTSTDIYLGKFDSSGQNLWNRTINGPQSNTDNGNGVAVDSSGNIYVTGYSYWSSNASGAGDIYLGKWNSSGSNLWNRTINGPQDDSDTGNDIAVDSSGNIYVTGQSNWISTSHVDRYLGKWNSSGSNLWNATLNGPQSNTDFGYGVAVDSSGNIYVTGESHWTSNSTYDLYLGKWNSSGSNLWNATINGPQDNYDFGYGVAVDSLENIYVSGYSRWSTLVDDIYLGKWNSSGSNLWNKTLNGLSSSTDQGYGVAVDSLENIYVIGTSYWTSTLFPDIYLGKFRNQVIPNVSFSGITNTINNGNYSGTIIVNVSVTDDNVVNSVYFNVTYSNGTQLNFTKAKANGAGYYNITLNTSDFEDNLYNITVYANDTAGNLNNTERIQITMDNTQPIVSFSGITNTINNGNYSGTIIVNVSVTDGSFDSVYFNVTYSNGTQLNFTRALANGGSYYNISINTLGFPDNKYNITVYANDSAGNLNNIERIQIIMDNTNPAGTMTCSPSDVSVGGTITCTCTSTDVLSGISAAGNTYTANPSTSDAGSGFTQTCTFKDTAGNTGSAVSNSYTIWSNVGSESSTYTAPSVPVVDVVTEAIPVTQPESPAEITISEPGLDLTAVTIQTTEIVEGLSVEVSTTPPPPPAEVGIVGTSYQAFEIQTFTSSSKIKKAKLDFKVNKSWVAERQGKAKDVRLHRKENNSNIWDVLPTKLIKEDNNSYYYAATTPGFSTFVIFLGTYECTPGEVRCAEKDVQMCLGNSTWLITEQCKRCRDNQCTAAVPISLIVYCALIAMAGIVVLFVVYLAFFNKKTGNKENKNITSNFKGSLVSSY